ncbi:hypothetical protein [Vibrio barjaei]|uniref:hypothetical protein n=1 Tax=Vibrio barjaei TaxID=1676683 RepID=UPI00228504D1|nr:hypothetical protein [Vibrio barjaei]MCY9874554.1 hypothetical protein [Vibrio barjaei]
MTNRTTTKMVRKYGLVGAFLGVLLFTLIMVYQVFYSSASQGKSSAITWCYEMVPSAYREGAMVARFHREQYISIEECAIDRIKQVSGNYPDMTMPHDGESLVRYIAPSKDEFESALPSVLETVIYVIGAFVLIVFITFFWGLLRPLFWVIRKLMSLCKRSKSSFAKDMDFIADAMQGGRKNKDVLRMKSLLDKSEISSVDVSEKIKGCL